VEDCWSRLVLSASCAVYGSWYMSEQFLVGCTRPAGLALLISSRFSQLGSVCFFAGNILCFSVFPHLFQRSPRDALAMVSQCKLVPGRGLRKRRSAPSDGPRVSVRCFGLVVRTDAVVDYAEGLVSEMRYIVCVLSGT